MGRSDRSSKCPEGEVLPAGNLLNENHSGVCTPDHEEGCVRMAECEHCGTEISFVRSIQGEQLCVECRNRVEREQYHAQIEKEKADNAGITAKARELAESVSKGRDMFLFKSIFVPVDIRLLGELGDMFNITALQLMGLEGWDMASAIPMPVNIDGGCDCEASVVHFILKKRLSRDEPMLEEQLSEYMRSLPEEVRRRVVR